LLHRDRAVLRGNDLHPVLAVHVVEEGPGVAGVLRRAGKGEALGSHAGNSLDWPMVEVDDVPIILDVVPEAWNAAAYDVGDRALAGREWRRDRAQEAKRRPVAVENRLGQLGDRGDSLLGVEERLGQIVRDELAPVTQDRRDVDRPPGRIDRRAVDAE